MLRTSSTTYSKIRAFLLTNWPLLPLLVFAGHNWFGPDIWYHLAWGRQIVRTGHAVPSPAVLLTQPIPGNPTWAFQSLMFSLFELGGPYLCSAFFISCWAAIGILWIRLSEFRSDRAFGLLAIALFTACVQLRLEYRPEVVSYLALMILLGLLTSDLRSSIKLTWVGLVQIAWTNVHAYYVLGPVIVAVYVIGELIDHGSSLERWRRAAVLWATTAAACFVSPTPIGSLRLVYHYAALSSQLKGAIEELMPTARFAWWYWPMPAYWLLFALVLAGAVVRLTKRSDVFAALVGLLGAGLSLLSFRNVPLLALSAAPLLGVYVRAAGPGTRIDRGLIRIGVAAALVLTVFIVTGGYYRGLGSATAFGLRVEPSEYPVGAANYLGGIDFRGRLFVDPNDGGYLEYAVPAATVLGDSYYADAGVTSVFFASRNDPDVFERLNRELNFEGAVLNVANQRLVTYLLERPEWTMAFADFNRLVFLRTDRHGSRRVGFASATYTAGEDLRRVPYLDAALAWGQLGLRAGPELMKKLVADVDHEPRIPSGMVKLVLMYAVLRRDRSFVAVADAWRARMFTSDPEDAAAIAALAKQAGGEGETR